MRLLFACLLLPIVALAGCRSDDDGPLPGTAQPAFTPAATAIDPTGLSSFDIVTGPGGDLVGSYREVGSGVWEGPSPDNGQIVQWSEEDADASSLVLYTEDPRVRTMVVYSDDTVSCSCIDAGGNPRIVRATYQ